jgi:hypothetical protein
MMPPFYYKKASGAFWPASNPSNPGKGMEKMLDNGDNLLTLVKSTDAIMAGSVIKVAKKQADELSNTTGTTILPTFNAQTEVQEEVNQLNSISQLVIGVKGGIVEAIMKMVGSNIGNVILLMADRSDHKSINKFMLFYVLQVAIDGADHPSMNDVLELLIEVINYL